MKHVQYLLLSLPRLSPLGWQKACRTFNSLPAVWSMLVERGDMARDRRFLTTRRVTGRLRPLPMAAWAEAIRQDQAVFG